MILNSLDEIEDNLIKLMNNDGDQADWNISSNSKILQTITQSLQILIFSRDSDLSTNVVSLYVRPSVRPSSKPKTSLNHQLSTEINFQLKSTFN